jgi:TPR repeat protein
MYSFGLGGAAQDNAKALAYYEKAATQDYAPALEMLATHYQYVSGDKEKALQYYRRAAAKGSKSAEGRLAEIILLAAKPGSQDEKAGLTLLQSAAEGGDLRRRQPTQELEPRAAPPQSRRGD